MKDPVADLMQSGVDSGVFPGGVLLCARGREILFHQGFGKASLAGGRPVEKDGLFDLASLTKPLATALAAAELVKTGVLGLDTCLGDVIAEVEGTNRAGVTIDMLLRHTSGLPALRPYYKSMMKEKTARRQILRSLLAAEPLETAPGHSQCYSDLGFMFLSWVIEILSGMRLDAFVRDRIYTPLKIKDLFFIDQDLGMDPSLYSRMVSTQDCPWRKKVLTGEVDDDNAWAAGGIEGHAGLFGDAASVHNLCCEILWALQSKPTGVLDPEILNRFVKKYNQEDMVAGFDTPSKAGSSAGRYFSPKSVGHLGFTGTSFWIDPGCSLIVVLLTNRVHPTRANIKIKAFRPAIHDLIHTRYVGQ